MSEELSQSEDDTNEETLKRYIKGYIKWQLILTVSKTKKVKKKLIQFKFVLPLPDTLRNALESLKYSHKI